MRMRLYITLLAVLFGMSAVNAQIGIIVNKWIYSSIRPSIQQYVSDLKSIQKYTTVWIDSTHFDGGTSRAECMAMRDTIIKHKSGLQGVVLVGDLPMAMFEHHSYQRDFATNKVVWSSDYYPIDYYFMDINLAKDTAWKDGVYTPKPGDDTCGACTPLKSGYFDRYTGDGKVEIWVSRVKTDNIKYDSLGVSFGSEASQITSYFSRVHIRMTTVPNSRNALLIGDFLNFFDSTEAAMPKLKQPYTIFRYPQDRPDLWLRELRHDYEWASIFEHSSPDCHNFGQDHGDNSNGHLNVTPHPWMIPDDRSYMLMNAPTSQVPYGGSPSRIQFFNDHGCSQMQFDELNCLGQLYAMTYNGLINFGDAKLHFPLDRSLYVDTIAKGGTFGAGFVKYVNSTLVKFDPTNDAMALFGAGSLKYTPYVADTRPYLKIDSVKVDLRGKKGVILPGDVVTLIAKVSASNGASTAGATLKWFGIRDSVTGNNAAYTVEGQKTLNSTNPYRVHLMVSMPGYKPAVRYVDFVDALELETVGKNYSHPNRSTTHNNSSNYWTRETYGPGQELHIRGSGISIGGYEDNCIFEHANLSSGDFEVSCQLADMWPIANYNGIAGVMIRANSSSSSQAYFLGISGGNGYGTYMIRDRDGGSGSTVNLNYWYPGDYIKLRRQGTMVYGYLGYSGNWYQQFSANIGSAAAFDVGWAFCPKDTGAWSEDRNVAIFRDMKINVLSDPIAVTPSVYYVNARPGYTGKYTAYFSYNNPNPYEVIVPTGTTKNNLTYKSKIINNWYVPSTFKVGAYAGVFSQNFDGTALIWNLMGKATTATSTGAKTYKITPFIDSTHNNCDGSYTVTLGYTSTHPIIVQLDNDSDNVMTYKDEAGNSIKHHWNIFTFYPGTHHGACRVIFDGNTFSWKVNATTVTTSKTNAKNICPAMQFYRGFAFGSDSWTRAVPNAPSNNYVKVVQNSTNFLYNESRGYGFFDTTGLDNTPNNRGVYNGNDEIYDQVIGGKKIKGARSTFGVDVPRGTYKIVAAGGDASLTGRKSSFMIFSGYLHELHDGGEGYSRYYSVFTKLAHNAKQHYTIGFDTRKPPAYDGSGTTFSLLAQKTSPAVNCGYGKLDFILTSDTTAGGGDINLLELWYIPQQSLECYVNHTEFDGSQYTIHYGYNNPNPWPVKNAVNVELYVDGEIIDQNPGTYWPGRHDDAVIVTCKDWSCWFLENSMVCAPE